MLLAIIIVFTLTLLEAFFLNFFIYKLVSLDAKTRQFKKTVLPLLAISGQRGEGLLLYLFSSRNHPKLTPLSPEEKYTFQSYRKKAKVTLSLMAGQLIVLDLFFLFITKR